VPKQLLAWAEVQIWRPAEQYMPELSEKEVGFHSVHPASHKSTSTAEGHICHQWQWLNTFLFNFARFSAAPNFSGLEFGIRILSVIYRYERHKVET